MFSDGLVAVLVLACYKSALYAEWWRFELYVRWIIDVYVGLIVLWAFDHIGDSLEFHSPFLTFACRNAALAYAIHLFYKEF